MEEERRKKNPPEQETISSVFVTGAKTVQSWHYGSQVQSTLKQYFTRGIRLKLEKDPFFPLFPFFLTSQLSFHLRRRMLWFLRPDVTLHPVHFKETNEGGREQHMLGCS